MLVATGFARMDEIKDTALEGRALTSETTEDSPVGARLTDTLADTLAETRGCVAEDERLETAADDTLLAEVAATDDARLVVVDPLEPPSPMDKRAELCRSPTPRLFRRVVPELPPMRARFSRCCCSWSSTCESYGPAGAAMVVAAKAVNEVTVKNRMMLMHYHRER